MRVCIWLRWHPTQLCGGRLQQDCAGYAGTPGSGRKKSGSRSYDGRSILTERSEDLRQRQRSNIMCGICGQVSIGGWQGNHRPAVQLMSDEMIHRGPDDAGIYSDPFAALGHRRLSIIDLSTGKQPISNENKTVWIVFNGEIYNYAELRARLIARGHQFATSTDTEVIVHL